MEFIDKSILDNLKRAVELLDVVASVENELKELGFEITVNKIEQ